MIRQDAKLNPKLFDTDVEQVPIRKGFGEGLLAAELRTLGGKIKSEHQ